MPSEIPGTSVGQAEALQETERALYCRLDDLMTGTWIPKSQIHDDSEVYAQGHRGNLVVKEWFARERGWI